MQFLQVLISSFEGRWRYQLTGWIVRASEWMAATSLNLSRRQSGFKNSVSLFAILTCPHIYSHKCAKNVAIWKNKKTHRSCLNFLPDASYRNFLWLCEHKWRVFTLCWFFVAILGVAIWYWLSRMDIAVLFLNQILRFLDCILLSDVAM